MTTKLVAALIVSLVVLAPDAALAQGLERDAEARVLFERGRDAWERGETARAVSLWEESFRLSGRPELLVNVGNARRRLGERDAAVSAYRHYLELAPEGAQRGAVEESLAELAIEGSASSAEVASPRARGPFDDLLATWIAGGVTIASAGLGAGLLVDGGAPDAGNALLGTAALTAVATVVIFFVEGDFAARASSDAQVRDGAVVRF